ncbi:DegT/DnrJ/EryC1/StrS family aminotransferase [Pontimicrobium sp. IMCC45349]|uniref:DegT/DnrJ/EryC1/StrS family aminotransferase n=1 Tax=Pontimicrobium sp. IMCC45349 TaxID=3391574 RepID=UPI0039A15305
MKKRIWLSPPHMTGHELKHINDAFASNWIAPVGPNITGFEEDIESFLNHESYAVALNSGTAAIHLALELLNIKAGDEVLCQNKTFIASVNPVIYKGATPIFIDSEKSSWNICPILLEQAIEDRLATTGKTPKAIIVVEIYGMPYNVDEVYRIASKYDIPIIEDSAEAMGSKYKNLHCGTLGNYSIFSFNGNKIITTSGGGALLTRTASQKQEAVYLSTQASDTKGNFEHSRIGFNYRMSNISASIGRGQIKDIDNKIFKRRANFEYYYNALANIKDIEFQIEPANYYSNRWLTCILFKDEETRNNVASHLNNENIETKYSWKPMHIQTVFKNAISYTNGVSEDLYKRGLCLPSGSSLEIEDLNRIINIIKTSI